MNKIFRLQSAFSIQCTPDCQFKSIPPTSANFHIYELIAIKQNNLNYMQTINKKEYCLLGQIEYQC